MQSFMEMADLKRRQDRRHDASLANNRTEDLHFREKSATKNGLFKCLSLAVLLQGLWDISGTGDAEGPGLHKPAPVYNGLGKPGETPTSSLPKSPRKDALLCQPTLEKPLHSCLSCTRLHMVLMCMVLIQVRCAIYLFL